MPGLLGKHPQPRLVGLGRFATAYASELSGVPTDLQQAQLVDGFDAGTSNESEKIVDEEVGGFTGISHEQEIVLKPFVTM